MKRPSFTMKVILLIVLLSSSGCKPSIILSNLCAPPCWNNITPGTTTKGELLEILESSPFVKPDSIGVRGEPWQIFSDIIRFTLISSGEVEVYTIDDIVVMLNFYNNLNVTFGEAFEQIGEPSDLLVYKMMGPGFLFGDALHTIVLVLNPENGFAYGYDAYYVGKKWGSEINPKIQLSSLMFFDPNSYEELLEAGMFSNGLANAQETLNMMQRWQGFGKLPEN